MPKAIRNTFRVILSLAFFIFFLWAGFAFFYQEPFGKLATRFFLVLWSLLGFWNIKTQWSSRPQYGRVVTIACFVASVFWWQNLTPSNNRLWHPPLNHGVTANINGNIAHINNIRNFDWSDPNYTYTAWINEAYDLDRVTSVDLYLSYWMGPYLAHSLVGFNFDDGRQLIFSSELRIEQNEDYSNIAGFFKRYELIMLAGTPEDIIGQRVNSPLESVFRYRLRVPKQDAKDLLLIYLTEANDLAKNPRFYNTLSANCTTVLFAMAKKHFPDLSSDYRVTLSGLLPYYLYEHGFIDTSRPLPQTMADAYISIAQPVPENLIARN